jgi:hypothetical protein
MKYAHLWCQIESQVTATGQTVFNQKGNLIRQAKLNGAGKSTGLAEVDEVLEGEGKRDRFGELDIDVQLWLLDVGVAAEGNGSVTNIAVARELDTILGGLDGDYAQG